MFKKMDHTVLVVKNMEEAIKFYSDMFRTKPWDRGIAEVPDAGFRMTMLPVGDHFIELVEPTKPESRHARHLRERGESIFGICFFVEDYDSEVKAMKDKGFVVEEEIGATILPGVKFRVALVAPRPTREFWIELVDLASLPPMQ
jgi:catechol 2,3-dioxygenase-like lactoylglutathione lyase family enzyme